MVNNKHKEWVCYSLGSDIGMVATSDHSRPHYVVKGVDMDESCKQLEEWLNGGNIPAWLSEIQLVNDLVGIWSATTITAAGPFVLPGGKLGWQLDNSSDAQKKRHDLISKLLGERKLIFNE